MRGKIIITVLAMAVAGAAVFISVGACERTSPPEEWNLLWIVIDDLKADHLGVAGYHRDVTPELDSVAGQGARFSWCVTQAPWSLPSYASMLASRHPYELVLGDNYLKHVRAETEVARSRDPHRMPELNHHWYVRMDPAVPTIAQVLKDSGFKTAAWPNNAWLSPGTFGLEAGFDHYFDGAGHKSPYTPADEIADLAVAWIRENASSRWFAFVQFMDPHRPYQPRPDFDFGKRFIDLYDAEIAFADREMGRIIKALDELGIYDRTIVVINSDHGEGVFEDDSSFVGHGGGVIPEIVRVPLIIKWPGGPKGRTIRALCRNLDVMPTALELLEVKAPQGVRGRSLLPDIKSSKKTSPEPAFTSSVFKGPEQVSVIMQGKKPDEVYQAVAIPAYEKADVFSITGDGRKPGVPEAAARLMEALRRRLREAEQAVISADRGAPPMLDQKTRDNLRALGYFQ
jgi:arylsulfatase A-like enzyme